MKDVRKDKILKEESVRPEQSMRENEDVNVKRSKNEIEQSSVDI